MKPLAVVSAASTVAVLAALTLGALAQTQAPPAQGQGAQPPIFRTGVNFVRVDAVVTDKSGAPLTDLKQEDFEVTEAGKRQTIATFKLIMLDGGLMPGPDGVPASISSDEVEEEEAAKDDVRLFTIFLDDYHVTRTSSRIVQQQVARFVETQLGPSDMVGVMYPLTSLASIRMTRDHGSVIRLLQQFEGRKGDYTPKNAIENNYISKWLVPPGGLEGLRDSVVFSALKGLAMHMGGLKDGRQTVVLVSEGYNSPDHDKLYSSLRDVAEVASRYHTAIYPVSPQILAPDLQHMPKDTMETLSFLAQHSGGRAIFDQTTTGAEYRERYATPELPRSQLTLAMKQMVVDASVFYLIGYNSVATPDDKFHKIDVKVKRRGAEVRHREGYWARKR